MRSFHATNRLGPFYIGCRTRKNPERCAILFKVVLVIGALERSRGDDVLCLEGSLVCIGSHGMHKRLHIGEVQTQRDWHECGVRRPRLLRQWYSDITSREVMVFMVIIGSNNI